MALPLPPGTLRDLQARSDRAGLLHLGAHLLCIAAAGVLVLALRGSFLVLPAMAVLGVLEVALFAPLHETTHRTPFRSLWLNRLTGWVAGFLLLLPPEGFRLFHLAHHRHTQDPDRDPEIMGAPPFTQARYLWVLTGLPYWGAQARALLRAASGRGLPPWIPTAAGRHVVREARLYLALYVLLLATIAFGTPLALLLWVVPVLFGQPVLRWVLLAEHHGCPQGQDRYVNTRTTLAGSAMAWLFWNANFHTEHHLAPGVPFHALPRLHRHLRGHLGSLEPSYPAAHARIRSSTA